MAKVTIKIPHVVWRDGRPRFVPGPSMRALGYKGKDLKRPDGHWMDLNETMSWSDSIEKEVATRRQQAKAPKKPGRKPKNLSVKGYITVGELLMRWHKERVKENLQTGKPSKKTIKEYGKCIEYFRAFDEELWTAPALSITDVLANGVYKALREKKGISMSKAIISTVRPAWRWAKKEMGLVSDNPWQALRMTTPPPRLRAGTIEEMRHLIKIADAEGRPDIGDAVMLGLCTGQRQNDRLQLVLKHWGKEEIYFKQSKTGTIVEVPAIEPLTRRLEAAKTRRKQQRKEMPTFLFNEKHGVPWSPEGDTYRKHFRKICDIAAQSMPSLVGFRDQDLRDTAVTWLADAGCTDSQICAITGHDPENVTRIMKHYRARTKKQSAAAADKLSFYLTENGGL